ncbi:MAG: tryptophan synthase subunit alpha [Chloroflexi bacterium]|nr:tryptophan synthase subunit alpha [Chloroflexota bacterium]
MTVGFANRVDRTLAWFRGQGLVAVAPYLTVGYPERGSTLELVPALQEAGAALVELGVPFSDPLADGTTIQRASARALGQGVTLAACLESVAALRARGVTLPLLLMSYVNPILQYGPARFGAEAAAAGADGVIVPDLPPEEADELAAPCATRGLHVVFLAAPTSSDERLAVIAARSTGFIYCVSLLGVTGARARLPERLPEFLGRVRRRTSLPLAVGFGISTRAQVEALRGQAEAAIVGSALLEAIEAAPAAERMRRAAAFIAGLARG